MSWWKGNGRYSEAMDAGKYYPGSTGAITLLKSIVKCSSVTVWQPDQSGILIGFDFFLDFLYQSAIKEKVCLFTVYLYIQTLFQMWELERQRDMSFWGKYSWVLKSLFLFVIIIIFIEKKIFYLQEMNVDWLIDLLLVLLKILIILLNFKVYEVKLH